MTTHETEERPTTIYSDLWYKLIATPRYNKPVADSLRRAHNHLLQRKRRSARAGGFGGVDVSRMENGKATGLIVSYSHSKDYAESRYE